MLTTETIQKKSRPFSQTKTTSTTALPIRPRTPTANLKLKHPSAFSLFSATQQATAPSSPSLSS